MTSILCKTLECNRYNGSVKDWACYSPGCPIDSGASWDRGCRNTSAVADDAETTVPCWKASRADSRPVPAGANRRAIWASVPPPARDDYAAGKNMACRSRCAVASWFNWTGLKASSAGVSLPPKMGRRGRQNQARQEHEVDGGDRRPRCPSPEWRTVDGSEVGRQNVGPGARAPTRLLPTQEQPATTDRRPGLRQRTAPQTSLGARHRIDLSEPGQPARASGIRRTQTTPFPRRRKVERTFAWLGSFRRLVRRYDRSLLMYNAFSHLACHIITIRHL